MTEEEEEAEAFVGSISGSKEKNDLPVFWGPLLAEDTSIFVVAGGKSSFFFLPNDTLPKMLLKSPGKASFAKLVSLSSTSR